MYIVIVLFIALLTIFWGWHKGLFHLVLRLAAILLAYALAWQETPALAAYLAGKGWLSGMMVWPVAGLALFFGGLAMFSLLARWFTHVAPEDWHEGGRAAGGLLGAVLGTALGLLVVWTAGTLQDSVRLRAMQEETAADVDPAADGVAGTLASPAPATSVSPVEKADRLLRDLSGEAMATVAQQAMGDGPAAEVAARWVREPMSVSAGLQHLARKPELRLLFEEPGSYAVMVRGSGSEIMRMPHFQALVSDPQVMQFLSAVGLPGETAGQQAEALANLLARYARNFEKLRTTPEFQSLAQDQELRATLQQGNLLVLLTNDKMRRLAEMLAQADVALPAATTLQRRAQQLADSGSAGEDSGARQPADEGLSKPLYRWKDDKGRLYITEEKPPEGIQADVIQP